MSALADFVLAHTIRGDCMCGRCIDGGTEQPEAPHTVDMVFFKVAIVHGEGESYPIREDFDRLTREHQSEYAPGGFNPLDGREYNYVALGAWIGDQGLAMQYMALGVFVGAFHLLSPDTVMPGVITDEAERQSLAAAGFLAVTTKPFEPLTTATD